MDKKALFVEVALASTVVSILPAVGATLYASPSGTLHTDCTVDVSPCSLDAAVGLLSATNPILLLEQGTYYPESSLNITSAGTAGAQLTIEQYPGANVVIDGTSISSGGVVLRLGTSSLPSAEGSYVTVGGTLGSPGSLTIQRAKNTGTVDNACVAMDASATASVIQNVTISTCSGAGIVLAGPNQVAQGNNVSFAGKDGIQASLGPATIDSNTVWENAYYNCQPNEVDPNGTNALGTACIAPSTADAWGQGITAGGNVDASATLTGTVALTDVNHGLAYSQTASGGAGCSATLEFGATVSPTITVGAYVYDYTTVNEDPPGLGSVAMNTTVQAITVDVVGSSTITVVTLSQPTTTCITVDGDRVGFRSSTLAATAVGGGITLQAGLVLAASGVALAAANTIESTANTHDSTTIFTAPNFVTIESYVAGSGTLGGAGSYIITPTPSITAAETMSATAPATDITVTHNVVYNNWGEGIGLPYSTGGVVRFNTVHDNYGPEIYPEEATYATIDTNLMYDSVISPFPFHLDGVAGTNNPAGSLIHPKQMVVIADEQNLFPHSDHITVTNNIMIGLGASPTVVMQNKSYGGTIDWVTNTTLLGNAIINGAYDEGPISCGTSCDTGNADNVFGDNIVVGPHQVTFTASVPPGTNTLDVTALTAPTYLNPVLQGQVFISPAALSTLTVTGFVSGTNGGVGTYTLSGSVAAGVTAELVTVDLPSAAVWGQPDPRLRFLERRAAHQSQRRE